MNTPNKEIPNITLPLPDFLEYLWGYRDKCVVNKELGSQIAQLQGSQELYCHLEVLPADTKLGRKEDLVDVWRLSEWRTSYLQEQNRKKDADSRIQEWEKRKKTIEALEKGIMDSLKVPLDAANKMAILIINAKNKQAALSFGVSID